MMLILVFGQMRRYKGLKRELAVDFMSAAPRSARLLLAGTPTDAELVTELKALAAEDDRVVIDARRVPDGEVSGFLELADLAAFDYRRDVLKYAPDVGTLAWTCGASAGKRRLRGVGRATSAVWVASFANGSSS